MVSPAGVKEVLVNQSTPTETRRMGHARLVITVVPLLLKRKAEEPPQLLIARAWPTRTVARRRASFVLVRVPVMLTAVQSRTASAQPTRMPRLVPMTTPVRVSILLLVSKVKTLQLRTARHMW